MKRWPQILALVVTVLACFLQSCVPPSQEQLGLLRAAQGAVEACKAADARVTAIRARIQELAKALETGADDPAVQRELFALVAELPAALQTAQDLAGQMRTAAQAIQDARGMDWKGWILPALTLLLGAGALYFPALRPAQAALSTVIGQNRALGSQNAAMINGVEAYRLAPEADPREVEQFIADEALRLGVSDSLRRQVKALTGSTGAKARASATKSVAPHV